MPLWGTDESQLERGCALSGLLIKVKCDCKHRFRAKARLTGRMVKCPNCETSMTIPPLNADMVSADGQEWAACPECTGPLLATAVICDNCGFSKRTVGLLKAKDDIFRQRLVPCVLIAAVLACLVQTQLKGVEFLWLYSFLAICGGVTAIGADFHDLGKIRTFIACVILFEVVGVVRFLYGSSIGMEKFGFLFMMMAGYPLLGAMFLSKNANNGDDSGWFLGSSCCGGGGGGGGGGGCGGCGGGD